MSDADSSVAFEPTPEHRRTVKSLSGYGVPLDDIALVVGCDRDTLRKHFRHEIDLGAAEAASLVGQALFRQATGGNAAAAASWLKARAATDMPALEKHPGGRPSIYSRELVAEIVARMAEGETLVSICRDPHMPCTSAVRGWASADRDGFRAAFQRARELQAHAVAEMVMQGARDATDANLGRLQMDAGKWFAAKLLPKVYSDRVAVDAKFELEENRTATEIAASIAARQARLMIVGGNDK